MSAEKRTQATIAQDRLRASIGHLESAYTDVERVVGSAHDAAIAVRTALVQARVADAKLELVIKRIPT